SSFLKLRNQLIKAPCSGLGSFTIWLHSLLPSRISLVCSLLNPAANQSSLYLGAKSS
ncbi:18747_t:CDS:1, partial [Racocetra persica]